MGIQPFEMNRALLYKWIHWKWCWQRQNCIAFGAKPIIYM